MLGRDTVQQLRGGLRQLGADQRRMNGGRTHATGQADDGRRACQVLRPVVAVVVEAFRTPVRQILLDDGPQVLSCTRRRFLGLHPCVVQLGYAVQHRHGGKSVERDMVRALIPQEMVRADLEHTARHEVVVQQVQRSRIILNHHCVRGRDRISVRAQVDDRHLTSAFIDELTWLSIDVDQTHMPGSELAINGSTCLGKQLRVQLADDLDVLGHRDRRRFREMLGKPDAPLRRGQWQNR